jgi:hypothetical protein
MPPSTPFSCSPFISRQVLQLSSTKATTIRALPEMAAAERAWPVRIQSTSATRKMVRSAATEESTGEVSDMSTRKEPEKAVLIVSKIWNS